MTDPDPDPDLERIRVALRILGEHFDCVHIFASRYEGSEVGTTAYNIGSGSWYSRYGQIQRWTMLEQECEKERTRIQIRDE